MKTAPWVEGNAVRLLENGEEFFPRVFEAISQAQREVMIETFILFEDEVGLELKKVLIDTAQRGVSVDITVDGWGSIDLSDGFVADLAAVGARVHMVDRRPRILGMRPNVFRRLHRKMVVIDGQLAFIGGINYSKDHLLRCGAKSKQDYAVEVRGPVVDHMHRFMRAALAPTRRDWRRLWSWRRRPLTPVTLPSTPAGEVRAMLVTRDNHRHRDDIERHYLIAIRAAQQRLIIANAYFLPGFRVLRQLAGAARRGVAVDLILQGKPDMEMAVWGSNSLYAYLIRAGVRIHEFCDRPLHGKVAVMDGEWATVGSSNLDPFSLSLNLEANLMIRDVDFNRHLGERLSQLIENSCHQVEARRVRMTMLRVMLSVMLFHLLRWLPRVINALPSHKPVIEQAQPARDVDGAELGPRPQ